VRLQEEILRECNDLSLFAWRAEPEAGAGQEHWGILAPSAREFEASGGISTWADPMDGNECAVTSKGLRVSPMPGCGLRLGAGETYFLDLKCHRRMGAGDVREGVGIRLRQVGCDAYVRVSADKLYKSRPRSGPDDTRAFYVGKTVTPLRSLALRESIRGAVVLSGALKVLDEQWGLKATSFEPEGYWDGQRSLFLTRGVRHFACRVRLSGEGAGLSPRLMTLECQVVEDNTFGAALRTTDVIVRLTVTAWESSGREAGGAWPRLAGKATLEILDGQSVYSVDVVDESVVRRRVVRMEG
jgi:hypothetical protein